MLACLLIAGTCSRSNAAKEEDQDKSKVGNPGWLSKMVFQGQSCFPDQELRRILKSQLDFVLAAEPDQPVEELLEIIQKLLRAGYQTSGFPDASVVAGLNSISNQLVVQIKEGPRYYCGDIRVTVLKGIETTVFMSTLNQQLCPGVASSTNQPSAAASPLNSPPPRQKAREPVWNQGQPASLDPASWARAELLVSNTFWELGHPLAQFTVDFPRKEPAAGQAQTGTADMVIDVTDEGPLCTIAGVHAQGTRNADEDIHKFLGVRTGEVYTLSWQQQQLEALEASGRFTSVAPAKADIRDDGKVTAGFYLEDLPEAAPLSKPLSATAETLLRMRQWVQDWTNRTDDLVWGFRQVSPKGETNSIELICSPTGNCLCRLFMSNTETNRSPRFQFIVRPGYAGMGRAASPSVFVNTNFHTALQLGLDAQVSAHESSSGNRGNLTFFFGLSSQNEDKPPLTLMLKATPAAMVFLAQRPDFTWTNDRDLLIGTRSNVLLTIEKNRGRLVELRSRYQAPHELTNWLSGGEWVFRFQSGRFAKAEADWEQVSAKLTNACDASHTLASGLAYLVGGLIQEEGAAGVLGARLPDSKMQDAQNAIGKLFNTGFFCGLERMAPQPTPPKEQRMGTPYLSEHVTDQAVQTFRSLMALALVQMQEAVPTNSWVELAGKLPLLSLAGHADRAEPMMSRLFKHQQLGPVACAVLGSEVSNPSAARQLAITGLLQTDADAFLKDAHALMNENSVTGQMIAQLARSISELKESEISALSSLLGDRDGKLLRDTALALKQGNKPLAETLDPLVAQLWNNALKEPVKAHLRKLTRSHEE